jgi:hypothetical protein
MQDALLWMYVVCYAVIWGYLPIVEWKGEPPRLRWFSIVIHWLATVAMILYLTETATLPIGFVWWALLVSVAVVTLMEEVLGYKKMMKKAEPRLSRAGNIFAALSGNFVEAVLRIPCMVLIYRLAERG